MDHLCYFCLVLLCFHARLFVDALWSPAGKGLTSMLSIVISIVTLSLSYWWCLIVLIPDLCPLSYFVILCSNASSSRYHRSASDLGLWHFLVTGTRINMCTYPVKNVVSRM